MRPLLYSLILLFASTTALAQSDIANEMAALRQLVENQSRLLTEQSSQLDSLTRRVAELEGHSDNADAKTSSLVALDSNDVPPRPQSTDAIAAGDTALEQKQSIRSGKESVIVENNVALSDTMDLYGSMRIFAEAGTADTTLNDGSSRLGIRLDRSLPNGISLFGRVEWKINLIDSDSSLSLSDNPNGTGLVTRDESEGPVLTTRLGYLGASIPNIGQISFGKQWGVYYDVAGWTDNFNVYGGAGLSTYSAGTDGGLLGSGRAEDAVIFRSNRGKFSYGLQTQLKSTSDGDDYKSLGGSLTFSATDSWDIGLAFAGSSIEGEFETATGDDKSGVATVGVRYHSGPWNAAFSVAAWKSHEAIFFDDDTLFYDGAGAEFYLSYEYSKRLQLYGGFNYTDPDVDDPRVDKDFGQQFLIFGASLFATKDSYSYIEALYSTGKEANGEDVDSVLSAGYRFDF